MYRFVVRNTYIAIFAYVCCRGWSATVAREDPDHACASNQRVGQGIQRYIPEGPQTVHGCIQW